MRLASVVLNVFDLQEAVSFYSDLLGLRTTVDSGTAALLVGADGSQLFLRSLGRHATHPVEGVGIHSVFWTAPTAAELRRCEQVLKDRHAYVATLARRPSPVARRPSPVARGKNAQRLASPATFLPQSTELASQDRGVSLTAVSAPT